MRTNLRLTSVKLGEVQSDPKYYLLALTPGVRPRILESLDLDIGKALALQLGDSDNT